VFRRRRFFAGGQVAESGAKDVSWIRADGREMALEDWHDPRGRVLGMLIDGEASDEVDERGRLNRGETLLLLLNAGARSARFALPAVATPGLWRELVNTAHPGMRWVRQKVVNLAAHSVLLLAWGVPK
jgi:glycogen operon protein